MKTLFPKQNQILLVVLSVAILSLACTLTQIGAPANSTKAVTTLQPSSSASPAAAQMTPAVTSNPEDITRQDPLDHLLALHSVQIDLSTARPDNSSLSIHIDIDSSGNMHIKSNESAPDTKFIPQGFDPKAIITNSEIWVVAGKSYVPNDQDPNWVSNPVDNNSLQTLSMELHGMDSPALWLNMLPDGSIQPAGTETVGGFAADKYTVNGKVDNQTISGSLWEEPQSDALLQAELHIPGALLSDPSQPQTGELKIELKAQKANVQPLTLPAAPAGTAQPQSATQTGPAAALPTRPSQPAVVAHYCIRQDCSGYQYPGDMLSGMMGGLNGVLLVLPGQLWTAATPGGIQEWDAHDGHLLNSIAADYEQGNFTDIQYDGKLIWASIKYSTSATESYRVFYIVDPSQARLIKKISFKYGESDEAAESIGISPGKVWLEHQWIDTDSFQINDAKHYFACDGHYAYDGQGSMWVTGQADPSFDCNAMYVWNAADPAGQPLPSDPGADYGDSPLLLAGSKMWMIGHSAVKTKSGWTHPWVLTAYNITNPVKPVLQVDISQHMPETIGNLHMAADNKVIWVAAESGDKLGNIDYYDQADGHYMGSLQVGQLIGGLGFDGSSLWVMDNVHGLEQIALPWAG
ncbi:MAG TPA: hypothetical protein VKF38_09145 [Anaerolineaceae bacterium]|nr:hypothetical protein [Anaerolineaceae bacterium]